MFTWFTQSYWRDEAFSVLLAQRPLFDLLKISAGDFSPPLYYVILKIWMYAFGPSEVATRLLSFILYIALLVVIMKFSKHVLHLSTRRSIFSTVFLGCINPLLLIYSVETRMYTMIALFATLSWYFFMRKNSKWYIITTFLGLYTHYFMVLILMIQFLYALVANSRISHDKNVKLVFAGGFTRILPVINQVSVAFILFVPWILFSLVQHNGGADTRSFWIPRPDWYTFWNIPAILLTGYEKGLPFAINLYPLTYAVIFIIIVSTLRSSTKYRGLVLMLSMWAFMPPLMVWILSQYVTSLFLPRYLIISVPAVILILTLGVSRYKIGYQIICLCFVLFILWNYQATQLLKRTKEDLRGAIRHIEETAKYDDYLIVESELDYHVAQVYWFDKNRVKIVGKTYEEIPAYVGKSLIPPSAIIPSNDVHQVSGYVLKTSREVRATTEY